MGNQDSNQAGGDPQSDDARLDALLRDAMPTPPARPEARARLLELIHDERGGQVVALRARRPAALRDRPIAGSRLMGIAAAAAFLLVGVKVATRGHHAIPGSPAAQAADASADGELSADDMQFALAADGDTDADADDAPTLLEAVASDDAK